MRQLLKRAAIVLALFVVIVGTALAATNQHVTLGNFWATYAWSEDSAPGGGVGYFWSAELGPTSEYEYNMENSNYACRSYNDFVTKTRECIIVPDRVGYTPPPGKIVFPTPTSSNSDSWTAPNDPSGLGTITWTAYQFTTGQWEGMYLLRATGPVLQVPDFTAMVSGGGLNNELALAYFMLP